MVRREELSKSHMRIKRCDKMESEIRIIYRWTTPWNSMQLKTGW